MPYKSQPTGFHARTPGEFAAALHEVRFCPPWLLVAYTSANTDTASVDSDDGHCHPAGVQRESQVVGCGEVLGRRICQGLGREWMDGVYSAIMRASCTRWRHPTTHQELLTLVFLCSSSCESNLVVHRSNDERALLLFNLHALHDFFTVLGKLHVVLSTCQ